MLLAQILLKARELVHDEGMEQANTVQYTHGDLAKQRELVAHESHEQKENYATIQGVHEAEVDGNQSSNSLKTDTLIME